MQTCDILIVGGGLMGCATAWEAARRGAKVLVAEKNAQPGRETTARSGAIIRAHYGVPELVALSLEANRRYANFCELVGQDAGFVACGYSVMVDEADAQTLRNNVQMHRELGANVQLLSPDELKELVPSLNVGDAALGAYEPEGGYANPQQTVAAFATAAQKCGAQFRFQAPVTGAKRDGESWRVTLGDGETVSARSVVLCTGNWSRGVGALFGVQLPVTPLRAQIVVLARPESFRGSFPVVSDLINLAYFREDGERGMWVGSSEMSDLAEMLDKPEGFIEDADDHAIEKAREKAVLRFAGIDGSVQRAFCGLYETTPDWQPIMDSFDNLHVAVGFSGHGFKLAPVVAEEMAMRAMNNAPAFKETAIFDLARFAENRAVKSRHVYERARFLR